MLAPRPELAQPGLESGSTTGVSPKAAAIDSRVRSSGVGPRPPVETTRSARARPRGERLGHGVEAVGQGRDPADPDAARRSAPGPARRRSCRGSRRPSARTRCSAARRSGGAGRWREGAPRRSIEASVPRRPDRSCGSDAPGPLVSSARPPRPPAPSRPPRSTPWTTRSHRHRHRATRRRPHRRPGRSAAGRAGDATAPEPPKPPSRPGLRAQFSSTRESAYRLAMAHVELAKAEAAAIGGEIAAGRGARSAVAVALVIAAVILRHHRDSSLFLGEWILGSIGWGVLHGVLAFIAIAMACVLVAVGVTAGRIGRAFALGAVIGILVGAVLVPGPAQPGLHDDRRQRPDRGRAGRPAARRRAWSSSALIGLVVGLIAAWRAKDVGRRRRRSAGSCSASRSARSRAITFGPQVAAGIGIAVGYAAWIALMGVDVARTGIDVEALKARFTPTQTIETSKETLEWLQKRMPPGIGSSRLGPSSSDELTVLEASARAAVDIPAKIRRSPAQGGRRRRRRRVPRAQGPAAALRRRPSARSAGRRSRCPSRCCPTRSRRPCARSASDGDKVRGALERDFAGLRQASPPRPTRASARTLVAPVGRRARSLATRPPRPPPRRSSVRRGRRSPSGSAAYRDRAEQRGRKRARRRRQGDRRAAGRRRRPGRGRAGDAGA